MVSLPDGVKDPDELGLKDPALWQWRLTNLSHSGGLGDCQIRGNGEFEVGGRQAAIFDYCAENCPRLERSGGTRALFVGTSEKLARHSMH